MSRIFATNFLLATVNASGHAWGGDAIDDVYMVTSDADLWPIDSRIYQLPAADTGVDVLSLNAFCCGSISHRDKSYRMIPMSNIGARVSTWRQITRR